MSEDFLVTWDGFDSNEDSEEEEDIDSRDGVGIAVLDADDLMIGGFVDLEGSSSGGDEVGSEEDGEDSDGEDGDEENSDESGEDDDEDSDEEGEEGSNEENADKIVDGGGGGDASCLDADDFMGGGFMTLKGFPAGVNGEDGEEGEDDSKDDSDDDEGNEDDHEENGEKHGNGGDISLLDADGFMSGGFMNLKGFRAAAEDGDDDDDLEENDDEDNNKDDDEEEDSDDEEANAKAMDLKGLAEKDPEFYEFLQVPEFSIKPLNAQSNKAARPHEDFHNSGLPP